MCGSVYACVIKCVCVYVGAQGLPERYVSVCTCESVYMCGSVCTEVCDRARVCGEAQGLPERYV